MVLKEITSEQDRINIALEMYKFTGIKEKTIRKTKKVWLFVYLIGIVTILLGLGIRYLDKGDSFQYFLYIFGIIYILRPTFGLLFLEKEYNSRVAKKIRKYEKDILKKYNLSENIEGSIEITDSYIETSSLGTISKYNLQDYVANHESEQFYILEFSNGRYIFIKKSLFNNTEQYEKVVREIENNKKIIISSSQAR